MTVTAPLVPIMSLLVQARLLPPEHTLLVAEMAGDALVQAYVSFLDPVMGRLCVTRHRGDHGVRVAELKAKIQHEQLMRQSITAMGPDIETTVK